MEAGADEEVVVVAEPPQAVRLSRAAAATPATVKVVRLIDCILVLLVSACDCRCGQLACRMWPFPTWWAPALGWCLTVYSGGASMRMGGSQGVFCGRRSWAEIRGIPASPRLKRRNPGPMGPGNPCFVRPTVRKGGLEPPRPKAQEPKSCVSANFTTRAWLPPKNVRRRMPGSIVALASCGSGQPSETSGINFEVTAQLGHMAGRPDVVLRHGHLALRVHHDG